MKYLNKVIDKLIILARIFISTYKSPLTKCDIILFCDDANRGETVNDKSYSRLVDEIQIKLEGNGLKCIQISQLGSKQSENETWGNSLLADDYYLFHTPLSYLNQIFKNLFKQNCNYIEDYYKRIFKKVSPLAIITVNSTVQQRNSANLFNIKIIEILHGLGYTEMPKWWQWNNQDDSLPDWLICFDSVSKITFERLFGERIKVRHLKHLWLDSFSNNHNLYSKFGKSDIKNFKKLVNKYDKVVLFVTQWGYAGDHGEEYKFLKDILENGLIPESIIKNIQETQDEILWLIRLHPVHLKSDIIHSHIKLLNTLKLNVKNLEWNLSSKLPLPIVLQNSDITVTMMSGTAYEAAYTGLFTVLLCPTLNTINKDLFLDLIEDGYAEKLDYREPKKILDRIQKEYKIGPKDENVEMNWNDFIFELKENLF